ncbi:MAG: hypothetical protein JWP57_4621, partial [Spirosoma sp.]|nr:hypothetical protein [Spirosoma sp.]
TTLIQSGPDVTSAKPAKRPVTSSATQNAAIDQTDPASGRPAQATSVPAGGSANSLPNGPTEYVSQRSGARGESAPVNRAAPSGPSDGGYRPAFTGDFATNRNGWKAGNKGGYNYQIGMGKYNIRKRSGNTNQVAFSYVPLPSYINLNIAETFTIKLDVVADSSRIPAGGLLFGVADSLNYCAFSLNNKGEISIIRVANGQTFSDYMTGDYFRPGVPVDVNRNRLMIRRKGEALHFYVNDREVRSSPYPFRMLPGNGIGMTTTGYWTSFQKLTVTLGQ